MPESGRCVKREMARGIMQSSQPGELCRIGIAGSLAAVWGGFRGVEAVNPELRRGVRPARGGRYRRARLGGHGTGSVGTVGGHPVTRPAPPPYGRPAVELGPWPVPALARARADPATAAGCGPRTPGTTGIARRPSPPAAPGGSRCSAPATQSLAPPASGTAATPLPFGGGVEGRGRAQVGVIGREVHRPLTRWAHSRPSTGLPQRAASTVGRRRSGRRPLRRGHGHTPGGWSRPVRTGTAPAIAPIMRKSAGVKRAGPATPGMRNLGDHPRLAVAHCLHLGAGFAHAARLIHDQRRAAAAAGPPLLASAPPPAPPDPAYCRCESRRRGCASRSWQSWHCCRGRPGRARACERSPPGPLRS